MFNFKSERINFDQTLGSGASGTVYAYQKGPQDKRHVVKNITTRNTNDALKSIQEIVLGFSCENEHVLPITGYHIDYNENKKLWDIYIKLPRMQHSLKSVLSTHKKNKEQLSEDKIVEYSYAIVLGLRYLHNRKIAHRDIKSENILVDEKGKVKIADFGLGNFVGDDTSCAVHERVGSLFYAAPENQDQSIQLDNKKLLQADLWSLGMLMLELCILELRSLDFSLTGKSREVYLEEIVKGLSERYSQKLLDIIVRLLRYAPSERISLREVQRELEDNYAGVLNMEKRNQRIQVELSRPESSDEKLLDYIKQLENELATAKRRSEAVGDLEESKHDTRKPQDQLGLENVELWAPKFQQKWKGFNIERVSKGIVLNFDPKAKWSDDTITAFLMDFNQINLDPQKESFEHIEINMPDMDDSWTSEKVNSIITRIAVFGIGSKLENLKHFKLNVKSSRQKANDEAIEALTTSIGANMPNLKTLSLNFASKHLSDGKGTNQAVRALAQSAISSLKHITNLELDFSRWKGINDQGLKELTSQINQNLQNLLQLSLDFTYCLQITDIGFIELAQATFSLKNLQQLSLHFRSCLKITGQGLLELSSQRGLQSEDLKQLSLNFSDCEKITDEQLINFASQLGPKLHQLQQLNLEFRLMGLFGLYNRSTETISAMVEHFKNVPNKIIR